MTIALLILRLALGRALILQGSAKLTQHGRASVATFFDEGWQPGGVNRRRPRP